MKVYGTVVSPFVRKVLVVLKLKGLEYELINVMPGGTPEGYSEISPLLKIPALVDGEVSLCDSTIICEYLEDQYPQQPVLPDSPALRARARWLEEFADSKLTELCGGGIFYERIAKPLLMQQPADEDKVNNTINHLLPPQLDYLESQLPEQGFLFSEFTTADISLASPLINAGLANYEVDAEKWPKLAAYLERVISYPPVAEVLEGETEIRKLLGL